MHILALLPLFSVLLFNKSNINLDTGGHCCHTGVSWAASTLTRRTMSQRNIFPPLQRSYQIFLIYTKIQREFKKKNAEICSTGVKGEREQKAVGEKSLIIKQLCTTNEPH